MNTSQPYANVKRLLAFFQTHPDHTFTAEEICSETGIAKASLAGAFRVLAKGHRQAVKVNRGLYRWDTQKLRAKPATPAAAAPEPTAAPIPSGKLFELIGGPTSTGELVLQSDSGDLFLARKL